MEKRSFNRWSRVGRNNFIKIDYDLLAGETTYCIKECAFNCLVVVGEKEYFRWKIPTYSRLGKKDNLGEYMEIKIAQVSKNGMMDGPSDPAETSRNDEPRFYLRENGSFYLANRKG